MPITLGHGDNKSRVVVSLCDYSGNWPKPYRDAGYTVTQLDVKHGEDLMRIDPRDFRASLTFSAIPFGFDVAGIFMAPPCTHFTRSGAQYWPAKDADGRTEAAVALVRRCLAFVEALRPKWWVLENPIGRLPRLVPELGRPAMYFNPCDYAGLAPDPEADRYTKRTALWGSFNTALPKAYLEPIRVCSQGSWVQKLGGSSERTKELRSVTPMGFANAFFRANP